MSTFLKNSGIVAVSQVGTAVTLTVVGVITARVLGAEGKGQLALSLGTGMILAQVLCLGFDRSATYHLASRQIRLERVLGSWCVTLLIGATTAYLIVYPLLSAFLMDSFFRGVPVRLLYLASLICPVYMGRLLINSIFGGFAMFSKQTFHNISIFIAAILSAVVGLSFLRLDTIAYTGLHIALGFCSLGFGLYILVGAVGFKPVFDPASWWRMFRYGIKATLAQILNLVDLRLDMFIVNYYMDTGVVGVYSVAASLANVFWMLANSLAAVLFPRSASMDMDKSKHLTALVCRNAVWITLIGGGLFLLVSRPVIIFVFKKDFADASTALALLMPGVIGQVISRICFTDCSAKGHPGKATMAAGVTAALTIVFDLVLIPDHGMYGAAVASSIAYCTGGVLGLYWHMKLSGNRLTQLLLPAGEDLKYYAAIWKKVVSGTKSKIRGHTNGNFK